MHTKLKSSKFLPILILTIAIIASVFTSIQVVSAGSSFAKVTSIWENETNTVEANESTFPYGSTIKISDLSVHAGASGEAAWRKSQVKSVSLDVVYGITKDLVTYHGELPYKETHSDTEKVKDGWSGYPYEEGTSMVENVNPDYKGNNDVLAENYWGKVPYNDDSFTTVSNAENLNKPDVTSLRLHALSHTKTGFLVWLGNIAYIVARFFGWLGSMCVSLVVSAKNLETDFILEILRLDSLGEMLTSNFIGDKNGIGLSPFTGFCIIMFMLALVGYAIRWVRGREKTTSIWSIIATAGCGALVIGICLAGSWSSLGSTLGNAANKLVYAGAQALSTGAEGSAFKVDITSKEDQNRVVQMQELSMVYKPYIDIQLCTQFNVNDVKDLNFEALGDTADGRLAQQTLAGIGTLDLHENFNNNLGYYYWFANSSAKNKTHLNATLPPENGSANNDKLSSMITYLQVLYNKGTPAQQTRILDIINGLSDPETIDGMLLMFAFTVVMVLLTLVLLKYAINVLIGKIELFIALIGLTVAGPLILTNKKKLVDTGKGILGMMVVAFLEITVWSIFFDLIIYVVASLMAASLDRMLVTIAFLLLFLKFNPVIAQKIKELLDKTTRTVSPSFHRGKATLQNNLRRKANEMANKIDNSTRLVGHDENGEEIREYRAGGLMSRVAHLAANATEDPRNRKTWNKLRTEANENRKEAKNLSNYEIRKAASRAVDDVEEEIAMEAGAELREIQANANRMIEATLDRDTSGNLVGFNTDKLTGEEANMAANLHGLEQQEKDQMSAYNALLKKKDEGGLTQAEEAELGNLESSLQNTRLELNETRSNLMSSIKTRAIETSAEAYGYGNIEPKEGESLEEAVYNAVTLNAQKKHAAEYQEKLEAEVEAHKLDLNNTDQDGAKIGVKGGKLNKEALTAQATAAWKLNELKSGNQVSSTEKATQQVKDIVDTVERRHQSNAGKMVSSVDSETKAADKEAKKIVKNDVGSGSTTSEQIDSLIRNKQGTPNPKKNPATKPTSKPTSTTANEKPNAAINNVYSNGLEDVMSDAGASAMMAAAGMTAGAAATATATAAATKAVANATANATQGTSGKTAPTETKTAPTEATTSPEPTSSGTAKATTATASTKQTYAQPEPQTATQEASTQATANEVINNRQAKAAASQTATPTSEPIKTPVQSTSEVQEAAPQPTATATAAAMTATATATATYAKTAGNAPTQKSVENIATPTPQPVPQETASAAPRQQTVNTASPVTNTAPVTEKPTVQKQTEAVINNVQSKQSTVQPTTKPVEQPTSKSTVQPTAQTVQPTQTVAPKTQEVVSSKTTTTSTVTRPSTEQTAQSTVQNVSNKTVESQPKQTTEPTVTKTVERAPEVAKQPTVQPTTYAQPEVQKPVANTANQTAKTESSYKQSANEKPVATKQPKAQQTYEQPVAQPTKSNVQSTAKNMAEEAISKATAKPAAPTQTAATKAPEVRTQEVVKTEVVEKVVKEVVTPQASAQPTAKPAEVKQTAKSTTTKQTEAKPTAESKKPTAKSTETKKSANNNPNTSTKKKAESVIDDVTSKRKDKSYDTTDSSPVKSRDKDVSPRKSEVELTAEQKKAADKAVDEAIKSYVDKAVSERREEIDRQASSNISKKVAEKTTTEEKVTVKTETVEKKVVEKEVSKTAGMTAKEVESANKALDSAEQKLNSKEKRSAVVTSKKAVELQGQRDAIEEMRESMEEDRRKQEASKTADSKRKGKSNALDRLNRSIKNDE